MRVYVRHDGVSSSTCACLSFLLAVVFKMVSRVKEFVKTVCAMCQFRVVHRCVKRLVILHAAHGSPARHFAATIFRIEMEVADRQSFDGEALGRFSYVGTVQTSSLVCSMLDIATSHVEISLTRRKICVCGFVLIRLCLSNDVGECRVA